MHLAAVHLKSLEYGSLLVLVLWTPGHFTFVLPHNILQLNHDKYSKGSFKGSLMLILQNNVEVKTMASLVPRMSRIKELYCCSDV